MNSPELTYVEKKHATPFDWHRFFRKRVYTKTQLIEACHIAASWTTCACGNQCAIIPRRNDGEPVDKILSRLGFKFFEELEDAAYLNSSEIEISAHLITAADVLNQIEQRSQFLIEQIHAAEPKRKKK